MKSTQSAFAKAGAAEKTSEGEMREEGKELDTEIQSACGSDFSTDRYISYPLTREKVWKLLVSD